MTVSFAVQEKRNGFAINVMKEKKNEQGFPPPPFLIYFFFFECVRGRVGSLFVFVIVVVRF